MHDEAVATRCRAVKPSVIYSRPMRPLIVRQLKYDLTPVAGLALVGHYLKRLVPVFGQMDQALPVRTGVKTSDIVRSYVGLLVQGKSDFVRRDRELPWRHVLQASAGHRAVALERDAAPAPGRASGRAVRLRAAADRDPAEQRPARLRRLAVRLAAAGHRHFCDGQRKRRRLKTVMQELVYRAGRLIEHGRRLLLGLGANDRAAKAFTRLHGELFVACGWRHTHRPACDSPRIAKTRIQRGSRREQAGAPRSRRRHEQARLQRDSAIRPLELAHWHQIRCDEPH